MEQSLSAPQNKAFAFRDGRLRVHNKPFESDSKQNKATLFSRIILRICTLDAMFDQPIRICALILCVLAIAVSSTPDIIDDLKNTLTGKSSSGGSGVNFNLDGSGASIGVMKDENMFYYMECRAGVSTGGLNAGCQRVWKALFYVCVVGGGLLAVLLLSCCFCCCCAPCRKKRIVTYQPVSHLGQISSVVVHPQTNPNPPPPSYGDVPMLRP